MTRGKNCMYKIPLLKIYLLSIHKHLFIPDMSPGTITPFSLFSYYKKKKITISRYIV